jgi:hypothetical protein
MAAIMGGGDCNWFQFKSLDSISLLGTFTALLNKEAGLYKAF